MSFNNYKFILKTYASSECEVTGRDIKLEDHFECDLKGVTLKEGATLFSPRKEVRRNIEELVVPDFNFKVLEVHKDGVVLQSSFIYSSNSSKFKISFAEPEHKDRFWFGRYGYSYILRLEKRQ